MSQIDLDALEALTAATNNVGLVQAPLSYASFFALIAELRAARKVVEAALDLRAEVDVNAIGNGYPSIGTARTFDVAVAELEALK